MPGWAATKARRAAQESCQSAIFLEETTSRLMIATYQSFTFIPSSYLPYSIHQAECAEKQRGGDRVWKRLMRETGGRGGRNKGGSEKCLNKHLQAKRSLYLILESWTSCCCCGEHAFSAGKTSEMINGNSENCFSRQNLTEIFICSISFVFTVKI